MVLSGFGPRLPISKDDSNLLGNFARVLISARVATRIQRAVVVASATKTAKDRLRHEAIADGKMRDAGRDQRDAESEIREFLRFEGNPRDQDRQDTERLGDGQFNSKVAGVT